MKGHLLCGEERVTVAWRDDGSSVDVEVVSLSKPAPGLAAKFVWPFAKKMQPIFFQEQLKALQNVAKQATIHNQHGPTPLTWQNLDNGRPVLPGISTAPGRRTATPTIHIPSISLPWQNAFSRGGAKDQPIPTHAL